MRHQTKLVATAFAATLFMAVAVGCGTASARSFSFSNRNFRAVWRAIEMRTTAFGTIRCAMTLEGSFHSSTIGKVEGALIGQVSRGTVVESSCTGGTATIKQESLPWHITYSGFRGLLPAIDSIRIHLNNTTFDIKSPFSTTCHIRLEELHLGAGELILAGTQEASELRPDGRNRIPMTGCAETESAYESAVGDGRVTLLGNTTRIRVTLI